MSYSPCELRARSKHANAPTIRPLLHYQSSHRNQPRYPRHNRSQTPRSSRLSAKTSTGQQLRAVQRDRHRGLARTLRGSGLSGVTSRRPYEPQALEQKPDRKAASASTAAPISPALAYSAGLWLIPPLQRTNSIAIGQRSAIAEASCVAPDGSSGAGAPVAVRTAAASPSRSPASQAWAGWA